MTIKSLFDENSFNQLYIRFCVQIFKMLLYLMIKHLLKYIVLHFLKVLTAHIEVNVGVTSNGGRIKHSNYNHVHSKTSEF